MISQVIALSVVERARKKQCARIANIKEGDANTKFFHMRVNAHRGKNHIQRLKHNQGWVTEHNAKEEIVSNHFNSILGTRAPRHNDFNWDELNLPTVDLHSLGDPFTEAEVKNAIDQMPIDKAPGPDGYTGGFFQEVLGHHQGRSYESDSSIWRPTHREFPLAQLRQHCPFA
jgi:hypothetical protein